ncbi:MAG: RHS repeat-associated core domain-containing protein [Oscillospiraceae bacterium]|nr:RHS repeat-associated core domain-containing protein [Oscillospiraceae bacterium]
MNNNRIVAQTTGSNTFYYSYDSAGKVISILYNNNMYYYLYNGQNDVVGLADANGNSVVSYVYDAWGYIYNVTGSMAATLGIDNPFRYRGYFYDEETKFYYLQSRYYDPEIFRFINADDFRQLYNAPGDILGANVFAYGRNNPVMFVDTEGDCAALLAGGGILIFEEVAAVGGANFWNPVGWAILGTVVIAGVAIGGYYLFKEHTKEPSPSKEEKHEKGKARRQRDQGGEKKKQNKNWNKNPNKRKIK